MGDRARSSRDSEQVDKGNVAGIRKRTSESEMKKEGKGEGEKKKKSEIEKTERTSGGGLTAEWCG